MLLFTIQSKLRATNRRLYAPSEGRSIADVNKVGAGSRGQGGGVLLAPRDLARRGETLADVPPAPAPPQAWSCLEKAEHEREASLRRELIRQEKLELLAQRFDHKVAMRETWLNENQRLVSQVGGLAAARRDPPPLGGTSGPSPGWGRRCWGGPRKAAALAGWHLPAAGAPPPPHP